MYEKIVNPQTGRYVFVNGHIGKTILKNYLMQLGSGDPVGAWAETSIRAHQEQAKTTLVFCHGNTNPIGNIESLDRFQDQEISSNFIYNRRK